MKKLRIIIVPVGLVLIAYPIAGKLYAEKSKSLCMKIYIKQLIQLTEQKMKALFRQMNTKSCKGLLSIIIQIK